MAADEQQVPITPQQYAALVERINTLEKQVERANNLSLSGATHGKITHTPTGHIIEIYASG